MAQVAASVVRVQRARGESTPQLARRSKIDEPRLERVLHGEEDLQLHTVFRLAAALEVTPATLLDGIEFVAEENGGGRFRVGGGQPPD
jgi:transcriptional regulator with XRE-family HTH domain